MNGDDKSLFDDETLNAAIRDALQIETDPQRVARLERYWKAQSRWQLRRRLAWRVIPLAAAALAAVAAGVIFWNREVGAPPPQVVRSAPRVHVEPQGVGSFAGDVAPEVGVVEESLAAGRAPTAFEQVVFVARHGVGEPAATQTAAVDEAIRRLVGDPNSDAEQALTAAGVEEAKAESLLLRRLPRASIGEQHAIVRLLAECSTPRSLPALLRLGRQDAFRDEVVAAAERIVSTEGLAAVVADTNNRELRQALLHRLLAAESESALTAYLSLVHNEATRRDALAVADATPHLPVDALFARLDHDDKSVRISAAMVLGHLNGPEVTRQLIARVTEKPADSAEAWMALLACRGELAEQFLSYAAHRPQLLGHYNSARLRWAQMIP